MSNMTIAQIIEVNCDYLHGCDESYTADGCGVGEARKRAADAGWCHKGKYDYCPTHARNYRRAPR